MSFLVETKNNMKGMLKKKVKIKTNYQSMSD